MGHDGSTVKDSDGNKTEDGGRKKGLGGVVVGNSGSEVAGGEEGGEREEDPRLVVINRWEEGILKRNSWLR